MFGVKLFYCLANYTSQHSFEKEIVKLIDSKKELAIIGGKYI